MKTLVIVRHAKSLHDDYVHSDLQRHLNAKGYSEAKKAVQWLELAAVKPSVLVSSPAIRAFTTAVIFAQHMAYAPGEIVLRNEIYEGTASTLLYVLNTLDTEADTVAIFGHNPGLSDLAKTLAPGGTDDLVTAGIAVIDFDLDSWQELRRGKGKLRASYGS